MALYDEFKIGVDVGKKEHKLVIEEVSISPCLRGLAILVGWMVLHIRIIPRAMADGLVVGSIVATLKGLF